MLRKCILLAVILAMIFSLSACDLVPTKAPTETPPPGTTPMPTKELEGIKITATDLYDEYEANEIAADQKYRNRAVTIAGLIADISREPATNEPYVDVGEVRCFFNNENELLKLANGQEIVVKGKCLGKKKEKEKASFPIIFKGCSLIEETEFQLIRWGVSPSEELLPYQLARARLYLYFKKFGYSLIFTLIDPKGEERSCECEGIGVTNQYESHPFAIDLTAVDYENPMPGEYKLIVKDIKGNVVATQPFRFSGPRLDVKITDERSCWTPDMRLVISERARDSPDILRDPSKAFAPSDKDFHYFVNLNISIRNTGDLPFYCTRLIVKLRDFKPDETTPPSPRLLPRCSIEYVTKPGEFGPTEKVVGPGEEKSIAKISTQYDSYVFGMVVACSNYRPVALYFRSPGERVLGLEFLDETGKVVHSVNTTLTVPQRLPLKLQLDMEAIEKAGGWVWLDDEEKCHYWIRLLVNIKNIGHRVLDFTQISVKILNDDFPGGTFDMRCIVAPGEKKSIWISTWYRHDRPTIIYFCSPGKKVVTLQFINDSGEVVYSMNTTITVPEKPPVE